MSSMNKWAGILLALIITASAVPLFTDAADANAGDSETNPLIWYNQTIILLPEVVAGEITDSDTQVQVPPTSLAIDWGDGNLEVRDVDGYVEKGSVEIVHTYATTGTYHITCTPQNTSGETAYTYDTYELWIDIWHAPTVYFYDGDEKILSIVATNGYGVGAYEDNYFSKIAKPADPVKEGYFFDCWTCDGEEFDFDTAITAPTILKAKWEAAVSVTVDGTVEYVRNGTAVADLTVPTKEGHTFDGWYSDAEHTVPVENSTVLTDGMTLYSGWTEIPTTYYVDGKEASFTGTKTVADVTIPVKDGYEFAGWYSDAGCTVPVDNAAAITDGMTLYSKFTEKIAEIKITIDGKETVVPAGTKVSDLTVPTKDGYTFNGWYSDEKCTVAIDNTTVLTEGMTLYSCFAEDDNASEIPIAAVAVCVFGALIACVGIRYHPAILLFGAFVLLFGFANMFGFIEAF